MPNKKISPQPQMEKSRGEVPPEEKLEPLEPNTLVIENEALRKGFTIIPNYILRDPAISIGAKLTYTLLLSYAWQEGSCFPGQKRLAANLGLKERMVRYYLTELKKSGFIEVKRRGLGRTNIYIIKDVHKADRQSIAGQERQPIALQNRQPIADKEDTVYKDTKQQNVVVSRLMELRIKKNKARELTARLSPEYIEQKIEFLEWKLDPETKTRGAPIKDPTGWLIRAIENDWQPPSTFKSKVEREKEAEERAWAVEEWKKQQQQMGAEAKEQREKKLEALLQKYGTTEQETATWAKVLDKAKSQIGGLKVQLLEGSYLLSVQDGGKTAVATIAIPNSHIPYWLGLEGETAIGRALAEILDRPRARLKFEVP